MNIIIAGQHIWSKMGYNRCVNNYKKNNYYYCETLEELQATLGNVANIQYIFFTHWSDFVPSDITSKYECVCFHPTALPFGRGGTPLQNLIIRGIYDTKITAFRMTDDIDAGPIYLQVDINIETGTARWIYNKISDIIYNMIHVIIQLNIQPHPQQGEPVYFKRRTPKDSEFEMGDMESFSDIYDFIRMLDASGYPPAYIEIGGYRISFLDPELSDTSVCAYVEIEKI